MDRKTQFCQDINSAWASRVELVVNNIPANAGNVGDVGLISGSGRSPGGGHSNPLQYSCLENQARGPWTEDPVGLQSIGSHIQTQLN